MNLRILAGILRITMLLCISFCTYLGVLPTHAALSSEPQTLHYTVPTLPTPQEILAHARSWTSIKVPHDQDPPYDGPTGYRKDCSGMVSMAWELPPHPNGGLNTNGLATVSHPISKVQLQPGDILLNTKNDAHVVIFGGWLNADKVSYDALEENGDYADGFGYAVEHSMPYPYYQGYFPEDYIPMRINGSVVDSPVTLKPTPVVTQPAPTNTPTPTDTPTTVPAQTPVLVPTQIPTKVVTSTTSFVVLSAGFWSGNGNDSQDGQFPMAVRITNVDGKSFSGSVGMSTATSDGWVPMTGTITSSSSNSINLTFTDDSGNTYIAAVSNKQINGSWSIKNKNSVYATFTLNKAA